LTIQFVRIDEQSIPLLLGHVYNNSWNLSKTPPRADRLPDSAFWGSEENKGEQMVLLEFSMYPLGQGESVSRYVARSLEIVEDSGLDYRCHAMGTVVEGPYDEVMDVVRRCFERMSEDCNRVECVIKMDFRRGQSGRLAGKVASVEEKLGRAVRK
jgi:uncharacterized protein (TIGR00106 family)